MTGREATEIVLLNSDLIVEDRTSLSLPDPGYSQILATTFGRDGTTFFVADSGPGGSRVVLVRKSDGLELHSRDYGHEMSLRMLAVTKDSRTLIVGGTPSSGSAVGVVSVLSADELEEHVSLTPCTGSPEHVALVPQLSRAYVRCNGDHATVADVDLGLRRLVRAVVLDDTTGQVGGQCGTGGIAVSPSGGFILAPCGNSGRMLYLDRLKLEVLDSVAVGVGVSDVVTDPDDPIALVTFPDSQAIAFVDLRNRSVTTRLLTPGGPKAGGVSGDGRMGYVLVARIGLDSAALLRVDMAREQIVSTVAAPSGSRFLALWPDRWSPTMRWK